MGSGECFAGRHQFAHVLQMLFGVVLAVSTDCSCLLLRELQEADAFAVEHVHGSACSFEEVIYVAYL